MPYTPRFTVTQDDTSVLVSINVPHIRVSDAELSLDGRDFTFWCKPYLLNLRFPLDLQPEDESSGCRARYDPDLNDGTIMVTLPKINPGEHFPGLFVQS